MKEVEANYSEKMVRVTNRVMLLYNKIARESHPTDPRITH